MVTTVVEDAPRVDPRVTRTRKLIRDALLSLLAEKTFESISVQDIAERATVNRATFYAHYTDKFALLDALVREDVREALLLDDPTPATSTRALLASVGKSVFAFVGKHRRCKVDPDFEPQFERAVEAEFTEFMQRYFTHCTAMLIASAIVGAAMYWRHHNPKTAPDPIVDNVVQVLVDGVEKHALNAPA
jgi:AcrR family transcriptional regulator